jgi:hypothetical protein
MQPILLKSSWMLPLVVWWFLVSRASRSTFWDGDSKNYRLPGWECGLGTEHLPSIYKALSLVPITEGKKWPGNSVDFIGSVYFPAFSHLCMYWVATVCLSLYFVPCLIQHLDHRMYFINACWMNDFLLLNFNNYSLLPICRMQCRMHCMG